MPADTRLVTAILAGELTIPRLLKLIKHIDTAQDWADLLAALPETDQDGARTPRATVAALIEPPLQARGILPA